MVQETCEISYKKLLTNVIFIIAYIGMTIPETALSYLDPILGPYIVDKPIELNE